MALAGFAIRPLALLVVFERAILGQEQGASVEWDPADSGGMNLTWQGVLGGLLFALACGGAWKLLTWFLESRRTRIRWRRVRYWWPTAMLVWGWIMFGLFARNESPGWLFSALFVVFGLMSFPGLILTAAIVGPFDQLAPWLRALTGSIVMWVGWYLMVRLAEWRAWTNAPISLHLADDDRAGSGES